LTFSELTTPQRIDATTYSIDVPDGWQQGRGAFGGLVLAMLARAAEQSSADPTRTLRSITGALCGPTAPGPAVLRTEILRAGNGITTVAARLVQDHDEHEEVRAHAVCVFGRDRGASLNWSAARAAVPAWESVPAIGPAPEVAPVFLQHLELRPTGGIIYSGMRADVSGFVRVRDPGPTRDAAYIIACADTYWPVALTGLSEPRPMATIAFTLELVAPMDGLPLDAPLYHEASSPAADGGYIVELRSLRGIDGRVVALNQQTFVAI
jgi:acyl-CoA thioesterase